MWKGFLMIISLLMIGCSATGSAYVEGPTTKTEAKYGAKIEFKR